MMDAIVSKSEAVVSQQSGQLRTEIDKVRELSHHICLQIDADFTAVKIQIATVANGGGVMAAGTGFVDEK